MLCKQLCRLTSIEYLCTPLQACHELEKKQAYPCRHTLHLRSTQKCNIDPDRSLLCPEQTKRITEFTLDQQSQGSPASSKGQALAQTTAQIFPWNDRATRGFTLPSLLTQNENSIRRPTYAVHSADGLPHHYLMSSPSIETAKIPG